MAITVTAWALILGLGLLHSTATADDTATESQSTGKITFRVISLSPSVTETLFALDVDSLLVGVTRYCNYPPRARTIQQVGGFLDPNLEIIVSLRPDLVIALKEYDDLASKLEKLNISTLIVDHQSISGIIESYSLIGSRLGAETKSDSLRREHEELMRAVLRKTVGLYHPTTLISIGHSDQPKVIRNVYVAAQERFYSELLEIAGGSNVVVEDKIRYPALSAEAIVALNPEYIIDLFHADSANPLDKQYVLSQWRSLKEVSAVRQNRVTVLQGNHLVIPGPRFTELLRELTMALHPEVATKVWP